tara:strand:+ start:290 stop:535 length:246 start_codon:yes stop_codon:yes gene_type:complete
MGINEALARVWPFGQWDIIFKKKKEFLQFRGMPDIKEVTVGYYFKYEKSVIIEEVWIQKIGGFCDGIRFKPRPRNGNKEEE